MMIQTDLAGDNVIANRELETINAFDGERQPFDVPASVARSQEPHPEHVADVWVGRHLPTLPAAAQSLCWVDQTGSDVRDPRRFYRDSEVATVDAAVGNDHRTVTVFLCRQTETRNALSPIHTADADETKLSSLVASAVCTRIRN